MFHSFFHQLGSSLFRFSIIRSFLIHSLVCSFFCSFIYLFVLFSFVYMFNPSFNYSFFCSFYVFLVNYNICFMTDIPCLDNNDLKHFEAIRCETPWKASWSSLNSNFMGSLAIICFVCFDPVKAFNGVIFSTLISPLKCYNEVQHGSFKIS